MKRIFAAALAVSASLLLATSSQATLMTYTATLTAAAEGNPADHSTGTGFTTVTFDTLTDILHVGVTFSGLTGWTSAAHIHCCTPTPFAGNIGIATELPSFSNLPMNVTGGSFTEDYNLTLASSFNPAFVTANGTTAGAEAQLVSHLWNGTAYLNIHTRTNGATGAAGIGSGEIRGILTPEPASVALLTVSLLGMAVARRRR